MRWHEVWRTITSSVAAIGMVYLLFWVGPTVHDWRTEQAREQGLEDAGHMMRGALGDGLLVHMMPPPTVTATPTAIATPRAREVEDES